MRSPFIESLRSSLSERPRNSVPHKCSRRLLPAAYDGQLQAAAALTRAAPNTDSKPFRCCIQATNPLVARATTAARVSLLVRETELIIKARSSSSKALTNALTSDAVRVVSFQQQRHR